LRPPRPLWRIFAYVTLTAGIAAAHTNFRPASLEKPTAWIDDLRQLPLLQFFSPTVATLEMPKLDLQAPGPPPCLIGDIPVLHDIDAMGFEANAGSPAVVNIEGLTSRTALALTRLERVVASVGGAIVVTSAYRPSAYQEHLQAIWDKWMLELRKNKEDGCQDLKAQVQNEFIRHQLLERQRPALMSEHSLGIAFDASIMLPNRVRKGRRVSLDSLARRAGVQRPLIRRDPVHFRLIGARSL
jgi:hypothetical protein